MVEEAEFSTPSAALARGRPEETESLEPEAGDTRVPDGRVGQGDASCLLAAGPKEGEAEAPETIQSS